MYLSFDFSKGGWVIDGFPLTREQWSSMIDNNVLPDFVVILENEDGDKHILSERFQSKMKQVLSFALIYSVNSVVQKESDEWNKLYLEYERQYSVLLGAIKGSNIEPILLDYKQPPQALLELAVDKMEGNHTLCTESISF